MGQDLTAIVCKCMSVAEGDIRDAIRAGAQSIEAVGKACEAGTGCQTCHEAIAFMLEEEQGGPSRSGRMSSRKQLSLFDTESK